ncbi:MAG: 4Fe-4S binding protein [Thermodesulfovibrionales bacterium]|nr:4Fe-4S binding protein [Thermodesulfovibrionales bacterium]
MSEIKEKKTEEIKKEAAAIKCPAGRALYYIEEFLSGPMCGKCFPCEMGSYEIKIRLGNIIEGRGRGSDIDAIKAVADLMLETSRCKKGKDTAQFIFEWLKDGAFAGHIEGVCPEMECKAFIEYRIIPEKCIMCGLCQEACKYNAITGKKKVAYKTGYNPYEIRQKRCVKCGDCVNACPTSAIEIAGVSAGTKELAGSKK